MTFKYRGIVESGKSPVGGISCLYALDETELNIQGAGLEGKLTPSNSDQTGAYIIQSALGAAEEYGMYPAGAFVGSSINFDSTQKVAIAFNIDAIPTSFISAATSILVECKFQIVRTDFSDSATLDVRYLRDGTFLVDFEAVGAALETLSQPPKQVCLYFDGLGGLGVSITYANDTTNDYGIVETFTGGATVIGMKVKEQSGVEASLLGETVQQTLVTSASDITCPVPATTKDICGNTI